jgi:AcrR family transcriptional regulator
MSRRQDIVTTAANLFASQGFHATTIAEISEHVGLSPSAGGVYRHFASKEALLEAVIALALERVNAADSLRADLAGRTAEPADEVRVAGHYLLANIRESRALLKIMERDLVEFPDLLDRVRSELIEPIMTALQSWVDGLGGGAVAIDSAAIADVLWTALVKRGARDETLDIGSVSDERFVEAWSTMLLGGLGLRNDPGESQ